MTYTYQVISTGETLEVEQRITEPAHEVLEVDGEFVNVRRLISGAPGFNLVSGASGGWSETGYAVPLNKRKLNARLGK
jgi:hypothetical protein